MEPVHGMHLGLVVSDIADPEGRNRVQVYVPHLSNTLYEGINKELKDISFKSPADLKNNDLWNKLKKILPWAEAAAPCFGGSSGLFNSSTGGGAVNSGSTFNPGGNDVDVTKELPNGTRNMDPLGNIPSESASNNFSNSFVNFIKSKEGFSSKAYQDGSQWSIGYGTRASGPNEVITESEAENRLASELSQAASQTDQRLASRNIQLTQYQKEALYSYTYNRGAGGLDQLLNNSDGNWQSISNNMPLYWGSNTSAQKGLINRRNAEVAYANSGGTVIDSNVDNNSTPTTKLVRIVDRAAADIKATNTGTPGSPPGVFSTPLPGDKVWVFFLGGDIQRPVYFAKAIEPADSKAMAGGDPTSTFYNIA